MRIIRNNVFSKIIKCCNLVINYYQTNLIDRVYSNENNKTTRN